MRFLDMSTETAETVDLVDDIFVPSNFVELLKIPGIVILRDDKPINTDILKYYTLDYNKTLYRLDQAKVPVYFERID